ncbi:18979_t:CDS:1, partial [Dentiscutata erythropus]
MLPNLLEAYDIPDQFSSWFSFLPCLSCWCVVGGSFMCHGSMTCEYVHLSKILHALLELCDTLFVRV